MQISVTSYEAFTVWQTFQHIFAKCFLKMLAKHLFSYEQLLNIWWVCRSPMRHSILQNVKSCLTIFYCEIQNNLCKPLHIIIFQSNIVLQTKSKFYISTWQLIWQSIAILHNFNMCSTNQHSGLRIVFSVLPNKHLYFECLCDYDTEGRHPLIVANSS